MRREVRLAGFGGQGIVLAGYVVGKAAALYDGKEAIFTQSYGPESRGGACTADVVISDESIDYPMIAKPDLLVIMSQEALRRYINDVREGATIIVDSDLAEGVEESDAYKIPATRLAEKLGNRIVANIVMLGFFTAVTGALSRSAMEEAIRTSVPGKFVDLNLRAFQAGYEYAAKPEVVA